MVRAILAGQKTQTRRVIRNPARLDGLMLAGEEPDWCPYGRPGDTLWVRETWYDDNALRHTEPSPPHAPDDYIYYRADGEARDQFEQLDPPDLRLWRSPIHMPRWASRITLEVTDVRVQRLQEISEEDAKAEGCTVQPFTREDIEALPEGSDSRALAEALGEGEFTAKWEFLKLWESINGKRAPWESNPFVWCVSFRRLNG